MNIRRKTEKIRKNENMNEKKIGIITYHFSGNYGAVLQAYALYFYLSKKIDVEIIHYRNAFIEKGLKINRFEHSKLGYYYALNDLLTWKERRIKIEHFYSFLHNKEKLSEGIKHLSGNQYDLIICGGDQIWNPLIENCLHPEYFGIIEKSSLSKGGKHIISFGSSTGNYKFNHIEWNKELEQYLSKMDCISVREANTKHSFKELLNIDAVQVLDPVFLLDQKEWHALGKKTQTNEKYILVYLMNDLKNIIQTAITIARKYNYKIYCITDDFLRMIRYKKYVCCFRNLSPEMFVGMFENAEIIITNSFHGMAFAAIFQKKLIPFINQQSPERILDFLDILGVKYQKNVLDYLCKSLTLDFPDMRDKMKQTKDYLNKALLKCEILEEAR